MSFRPDPTLSCPTINRNYPLLYDQLTAKLSRFSISNPQLLEINASNQNCDWRCINEWNKLETAIQPECNTAARIRPGISKSASESTRRQSKYSLCSFCSKIFPKTLRWWDTGREVEEGWERGREAQKRKKKKKREREKKNMALILIWK